jgi:hypothetical protein
MEKMGFALTLVEVEEVELELLHVQRLLVLLELIEGVAQFVDGHLLITVEAEETQERLE